MLETSEVAQEGPSRSATARRPSVYVLDSSVVFYQVLRQLEASFGSNLETMTPKQQLTVRQYVEASVDYVGSLVWLAPNVVEVAPVIIWAADSKPYWRKSLYPAYKEGRPPKHNLFFDIEKAFRAKSTLRKFPGYEADDLAALIVQVWASSNPKVLGDLFLCTVDTDWIGLVRYSEGRQCRVLDTTGYAPRVRSVAIFEDWLERRLRKESRAVNLRMQPWRDLGFKPADIWTWKSIAGDRSDNLAPGSDLSLISLLEPPDKFNLYLKSEAVKQAQSWLSTTTEVTSLKGTAAARLIYSLGMDLPIKPLGELL